MAARFEELHTQLALLLNHLVSKLQRSFLSAAAHVVVGYLHIAALVDSQLALPAVDRGRSAVHSFHA